MDQIAFAQQEAVPHVTHITGDLRGPVAVGIMRDSSATDFSGADIHEKQQMPPLQATWRCQFHMGEIGCCRNILLRFYKLKPVPAPSAFRSGTIP